MTQPSTLYDSAMALEYPSCHAGPGVLCNAPNKTARLERADRLAAEAGIETRNNPLSRLHKTRQQAAMRRRQGWSS